MRSYLSALLPAMLAGLAGGLAYILGAEPIFSLAVAVIAAAAVGLIAMRDETFITQRREEEADTPKDTVVVPRSVVLDALDALPVGLLIVRKDRTIGFANAVFADLFGLRETMGQPVATLRSRRLLDRIDLAFRHGTASTLEFSLSRAGDAYLKAHVRVLDHGDVAVAVEDETHARRANDLHRDFVANASHELKTPLAAISGIIETLLGHAREDPDATERFMGLLSAQATRMTGLIQDLMSLNRIELNERVAPNEPQDLITIVSETVDALRPIAEASDVTLSVDLPKNAPKILGDRDELSQLFGNLVDNAIKYGGAGTTVHVTAMIGADDYRNAIGISVRDQGPGIAREHIPRLTERFYRVNVRHSREKGGTGLGLAIVKHIANRHRGWLDIDSQPGEGSRFAVWLPVYDASASGDAAVQENAPEMNQTRIADDQKTAFVPDI